MCNIILTWASNDQFFKFDSLCSVVKVFSFSQTLHIKVNNLVDKSTIISYKLTNIGKKITLDNKY